MALVSRFAIGAALALGTLGAAAQPAAAQKQRAVPSPLSKEERAALLALETALNAKDYTAATSALASAQAAARSPEGRYYTASLQLRLGRETTNIALQSAAIDALLESNSVPAEELPELYKSQGVLALGASKWDRAERAFTRWIEVAPNDTEALLSLAEIKDDRKQVPEAIALMERAIAIRAGSGQPVPESWYKRIVKHAFDAKAAAQSLRYSRELVATYPSEENWRDAILIHRDIVALDAETKLDLLRLLRASRAMGGERDYAELANALSDAKLPGEAKAVLDEGVSARMIDPAKPAFKALIAGINKRAAADKAALAKTVARGSAAAATGAQMLAAADASFAFADYAKAADLYRAALAKDGVDPNLANIRIGMALALAGRKPEAEAAFRAVTGPKAEIANLWISWLSRRG